LILGLVGLSHGCGWECGNPGGCPGLTADAGASPTTEGLNGLTSPWDDTKSLYSGRSDIFSNKAFLYQTNYPLSWSVLADQPSEVQFTKSLSEKNSTVTITAEELTESIDDLLDYAKTNDSQKEWYSFVTSTGLTAVFAIQTGTASEGATVLDFLFTNDLILLKIHEIRNPYGDGDSEANFIVDSIEFTPN